MKYLPGILAIIFFIIMAYLTRGMQWGFILTIFLPYILYILLIRWLPSDQDTTARAHVRTEYLEGVVRGFKESRQIKPRFNQPDEELIVWSYQLERHSETEERLDPIPVEMRGRYFSGTINEGNVVRLYEQSWHGGIVRTKRVYNATYKEDIMAQTQTIGTIVGIIIATIVLIFFLYIFLGILFHGIGRW